MDGVASVAQTVGGLHVRIKRVWPIDVADDVVLTIGLCLALSGAKPTLELALSRRLEAAVAANSAAIAINAAEFTAVLVCVSKKPHALGKLEKQPWFAQRTAKIERAMACTIAEAKTAWARPSVRLACVLAFQATEPPVSTLDLIFGSVVRSDVRRIDDLFCETGQPPPPAELSAALEYVCEAVL